MMSTFITGGWGQAWLGSVVILHRLLSTTQGNILVAILTLYSSENWKIALTAKEKSPVGQQ